MRLIIRSLGQSLSAAGWTGGRRRLAMLLSVGLAAASSGAAWGRTETPQAGPIPRLDPPLSLVRAADGDSGSLRLKSGEVIKFRMVAIDAPERSQPHARPARVRLEELLRSPGLKGHAIKRDVYGRWVVSLNVSGKDVGQTLIQEGHAWFYRRYRSDLPFSLRASYEEAQAVAREERRGLWKDANPEPPWQYRASHRSHALAEPFRLSLSLN